MTDKLTEANALQDAIAAYVAAYHAQLEAAERLLAAKRTLHEADANLASAAYSVDGVNFLIPEYGIVVQVVPEPRENGGDCSILHLETVDKFIDSLHSTTP